MSTITVDIQNTQINWQAVLSEMRAGSKVVLVDGETPVAQLTPVEESEAGTRIPDLSRGAIWTSEDFDDPLPDEFWLGEK
jgi:antitoxin (DNA-binding transcriptional repressor) of toxin-antitoxin stability system